MVDASFVNENEVVCMSPFVGSVGPRVVSVSNNGLDFGVSSSEFDFVDEPEINSIRPKRGSVAGGTVVTITGAGFTSGEDSSCKFGEAGSSSISMIYVSENEVHCVAPASATAGSVDLELTFNGGDYASAGGGFEYILDASFSSMSPQIGPVSGGTVVLISGYNFVDSSDMSCKFGAGVVSARFISTSQIECVSPTSSSEFSVELLISQNGVDFATSSTPTTFTYQPTISISSISPTFGPSSGNTQVTVAGTNFEFGEELACKFGSGSSR